MRSRERMSLKSFIEDIRYQQPMVCGKTVHRNCTRESSCESLCCLLCESAGLCAAAKTSSIERSGVRGIRSSTRSITAEIPRKGNFPSKNAATATSSAAFSAHGSGPPSRSASIASARQGNFATGTSSKSSLRNEDQSRAQPLDATRSGYVSAYWRACAYRSDPAARESTHPRTPPWNESWIADGSLPGFCWRPCQTANELRSPQSPCS